MASRRIFFRQLKVDARLGMLPHELERSQPLVIDADFDVDIDQPVQDSDIDSVLDYRRLRETLIAECTRGHVHLLETLSERLLQRLLDDFPQISALRVSLGKPQAFDDCAMVGIEIRYQRPLEDRPGITPV